MVIETGRLRIVPLDADMLETLSRDVKEFEREYDAKYDGESINDELKSILGRCAEEVREDEDNKVFLTTWLIELKGVVIGSIGFKGVPKGGETEIRFCLNKKIRRQRLHDRKRERVAEIGGSVGRKPSFCRNKRR